MDTLNALVAFLNFVFIPGLANGVQLAFYATLLLSCAAGWRRFSKRSQIFYDTPTGFTVGKKE